MPIATSAISASIVFSAPFASATVIFTPFSPASVFVVFVFVKKAIPCFVNDFSSACETSVSSIGSRFGSISTSVTFVPNALKKYANSTPIAPAPMITTDFGCSASCSASLLPMTVFPLNSSPGSGRDTQPVAIRTFFATCVSSLPSAAFTFTSLALSNDASPRSQSILFFLKRKSTPAEPFAALIGIDWADQQHAVALLDCTTGAIERSTLPQQPEAIAAWAAALLARFGGRPLAVCLEQSKGALIYALSASEFLVLHPINPATSALYRQAFTTSRAKDDPDDAQICLELLRHHREKLRP